MPSFRLDLSGTKNESRMRKQDTLFLYPDFFDFLIVKLSTE